MRIIIDAKGYVLNWLHVSPCHIRKASSPFPFRVFVMKFFFLIGAVAQTRIPLSGSLKRFLFINLGEAEDQQCQLFEPGGRV